MLIDNKSTAVAGV